MIGSAKHIDSADPDLLASRLLRRSHHRDGLPETATGIFFLMASGLAYAFEVLPKGSLGYGIAVLTFSLGLPAAIFCIWPLIRWVRRRYLVPREGYVQYEPMEKKKRVKYIWLGLTILVLLAIVSLALPPPGSWLFAFTGIFSGLLFAAAGRLPRFVVGGVLMGLAGLVLSYTVISINLGMAALFGFQGAVAAVSGGATFVRFLNQPPTGAESDECEHSATQRS